MWPRIYEYNISRHRLEYLVGSNRMLKRKLFEVWGGGTEDAARRWDATMHALFERHGIHNKNALAEATGINRQTIYKSGHFDDPHAMTYSLFSRICKGLGEDAGKVLGLFFEYDSDFASEAFHSYKDVKAKASEALEAFLTLDPTQQEVAIRLLNALKGDSISDMWGGPHAHACVVLGEQLANAMLETTF